MEIVLGIVALVGSEVRVVILPLVLEILKSLAGLLDCIVQIVGDLAEEVIEGVLQVIQVFIPDVLALGAGELLDILGVQY